MISARKRSFKECSGTAGNGFSVNGRSVNRPRRQIPSRSSSPPGAPSRRPHGSLRSAPSPQPALAAPGGHQRPGHATPTRGRGARKGRGRFKIRTLAVAVFPLPRAPAVSVVMPPLPLPSAFPPRRGHPLAAGAECPWVRVTASAARRGQLRLLRGRRPPPAGPLGGLAAAADSHPPRLRHGQAVRGRR